MSTFKHTLYHKARGKLSAKPLEIPLTVEQATHLLSKKMAQKTGSIPGQIHYHSQANLSSLKKAMHEVEEAETKAKAKAEAKPAAEKVAKAPAPSEELEAVQA